MEKLTENWHINKNNICCVPGVVILWGQFIGPHTVNVFKVSLNSKLNLISRLGLELKSD